MALSLLNRAIYRSNGTYYELTFIDMSQFERDSVAPIIEELGGSWDSDKYCYVFYTDIGDKIPAYIGGWYGIFLRGYNKDTSKMKDDFSFKELYKKYMIPLEILH